jgi:hypothetical protein
VSHRFLNPVRRNIYRDVRIEGTERFLLLTGQLRFAPHLAKFVKSASLVSNCAQGTLIDETGLGWEPRNVGATVLKWFLEACPQLKALDIFGGDFLPALATQVPNAIKLTDITLMGCSQCERRSQYRRCMEMLESGWLKNIVTFPHLKELDITGFPIGAGLDATRDVQSGSSVCTGLSISNMNQPTRSAGLKVLLRAMPALADLILDGIETFPNGELKKCLEIVQKTLTLLTITDYHSTEEGQQPWEDDCVAVLHQLKILSLNGVPVTPQFFDTLPPRLEHLRFSGSALMFLPAPVLAGWLRREKFPLRGVLKKLEVVGDLKANTQKRGPKASEKQLAELAQLCSALGIEWIYTPDMYGDFF